MEQEEFENQEGEKKSGYMRMKSILDYGMGVLWIGMGIFLLSPDKYSNRFEHYDNPMMKFFAVVCILYGGFRIYRGYKKNYYSEK